MKKSLIIIATVAILGTLSVYAIPLSTKSSTNSVHSTSQTSAEPVATTTLAATSATTSSATALRDGTYTGDAATNRFGDVQLKITVANGKITNINPIQYPNDDGRSVEINQYAIPELTQEALAAQSSEIDVVSGASYTSYSYIDSLQSAINQAKS